MFLTVHATVGITVGQASGNIWLAFIAGLLSHFVLDIIPHGDDNLIEDKNKLSEKESNKLFKLGIIDGLIMSVLVSILYLQNQITLPILALSGVIGSILPDFIQGLYLIFKTPLLNRYFIFHGDIHFALFKKGVSFKVGLLIQGIILVLASILIVIT